MGRLLAPTLALAAITPFASAISLEDADGNKLGFGIRLQNRVDWNGGINDVAGDPITDNEDVDTLDLYVRRVRLYLKGKAEWGQKFNLTFSADDLGNAENGKGKNDSPKVRYAWVAQEFKTESGKHTIKVGLQKPYLARAESLSSSKRMTTTAATGVADIAADYVASRDMGITYGYKSKVFGVYANLMEPSANDIEARDWQVSVRVETSLSEDASMKN